MFISRMSGQIDSVFFSLSSLLKFNLFIFHVIGFIACPLPIAGKKLNCGKGEVQVRCRCFYRQKLVYLLDSEIDSINQRIKATRQLKARKQAIIHNFIRANGAKIGAAYRCKRRRYQALREVFHAARHLRVVRALRVRCWHYLAMRWKLKRQYAKIKKYIRILERKLRSSSSFLKHFMKTYKRAKLYSGTKSCKIIAYRLRHVIWFQRHRKIRTQQRLSILKGKAENLRRLSRHLKIKSKSVCHTAKVLQARAQKLRQVLIKARKRYHSARQCTQRLKGAFRRIQRQRYVMYLWLNKTRRFLRNLYRIRFRKIKLLCSKVKPTDTHCRDLNIKLDSYKRFKSVKHH